MTQNEQIKSVQTALGLDADGKPGPKTWSAIYDRIVGTEKPPLQVARTRPLRVCIDPGHGMSNKKRNVWDGGCERGTLKEANIVLDYGIMLRAMLERRGIEVVMTRQDQQKHTPLTSRAALAEVQRCDMLVSIHVNDSNPSATGTETLIRSASSKPLASRLQLAMLSGLGLKDRGVKVRDDLAVLKLSSRPAALLELGFIETDGRKITNPAAMRKTCELLAAAIAEGSK